jgi:hypothetical protein
MVPVTAMSAVHEHVHERANEHRQPNEYSEDMSPVLGKQERASDDRKPDEDESCRRREETALGVVLVVRMIVQRHRTSPIRQ